MNIHEGSVLVHNLKRVRKAVEERLVHASGFHKKDLDLYRSTLNRVIYHLEGSILPRPLDVDEHAELDFRSSMDVALPLMQQLREAWLKSHVKQPHSEVTYLISWFTRETQASGMGGGPPRRC